MRLRDLRAFFGKLVDPTLPIGEIVSPSDIFKTRQGLPTHVARANLPPPPHLEAALAAPRFVAMNEATDVPRDRVRQVSVYVEEHWAPVMRSTASTDLVQILLASQEQIGWQVTQRKSQQARRYQSAEDFQQVLQTAQIQASDEFYVGYAETIPGNDPVILDGELLRARDGTVIRGGTQIRGRKHYRQTTKDMVLWDKGFMAQREAALAEEASRPVRNVKRAMEAVAGDVLPMWRATGINLRRDRRAV